MPWKLILIMLLMAIVVVFAGFNLTNSTDISFGFFTFKDVPVFISIYISFLCGTFLMLPFTVFKKKKKLSKKERKLIENETTQGELENNPEDAKATKKSKK